MLIHVSAGHMNSSVYLLIWRIQACYTFPGLVNTVSPSLSEPYCSLNAEKPQITDVPFKKFMASGVLDDVNA